MSAIRQAVIAVGIDGSPESMVAARWAADEAARRQLSLRLLHAYATTPLIGVPAYGVPSDINEGLIEAGTDALSQAVAEIQKSQPEVAFTAELVKSDPRPALIEASGTSMLTVIGRSGGGRIPEVILGSVALHVAAHGRSPVAVISTHAPEPSGGPVVLGVNGSAISEDAVSYAFDEASRRHTRLDAVLSWDDLAMRGGLGGGTPEMAAMEDEEEHVVLAEQLAGWRDKFPDVEVHQIVAHGKPAEAILLHAQQLPDGSGPQMIVVGSRGRGGLTGLLLGSTSQRLICHSPWPVVVVRQGTLV
jgi:nucleotide-binding universal stress UspA family protein